MLKPISRIFFAQFLLCGLALLPAYPQKTPQSLLILNAQVADGTGAPLYRENVRIAGNRIVAIGKLAPEPSEATLDAKGLVLALGFIDIHNHSEESLPKDLAAETQVSQGITTLIIGADGESPWPLASWFHQMQDHPAAVNVGSFAGHATIREPVMGKDFKRTATPDEVRLMEERTRQEMNEGALGLSSGLEYEVGSYAATDEVVALSKIAAASGGVYMTHIRDEADKSFEALEDEIAIGERAHIPVEHSHIKLGTVGVQGKAAAYIKIIEAARKRGVIRKGSFADLVLFDPATVIDRSTFADPMALSTGIEKVFVNGVLVWDSGKPTGARPGAVIGRKGVVLGAVN